MEEQRPKRRASSPTEARHRYPAGYVQSRYPVIVSNIPPAVCWQELKDFGRLAGGQVAFCNIDKNKKGRGFIEYLSADDAVRAVRKLNGTKLLGNIVEVYRREPRRHQNGSSQSRSPYRLRDGPDSRSPYRLRDGPNSRSPYRLRDGPNSRSCSNQDQGRFRSSSPPRCRTSYHLPTNPSDATSLSESALPQEYRNQHERDYHDDYYKQYVQAGYAPATDPEHSRHDLQYSTYQW